jgi:hypothetical protein
MKEIRKRGGRFIVNGRVSKRLAGPTIPVCMDCNNTWMSTIENNVKPLVILMLDNAWPLSRSDQTLLATWATKIALSLDLATGSPVIPRGFGYDLRIHKQPQAGVRVWLGAYTSMTDALAIHVWDVMSEDAESEEIVGRCITFSVVRMVFQVFIPFWDAELSERLTDFGGNIRGIWPPESDFFDWPPRHYFDELSIVALSKRIYDNREPVVVEVNLKQAVIRPPSGEPDLPELAKYLSRQRPKA